jgi:hypothetical protein
MPRLIYILAFGFHFIWSDYGYSGEICNSNLKPQSQYTQTQTEIEIQLDRFSQSPKFAKDADTLLSKMISAKSPAIISWISKRDLQNKTEDEIVKTWRKYYALNFIIAKYPFKDSQIDIPIEFLFTSLSKLFDENGFSQKMEVYFKRAQEAAITTVKKYKFEKQIELQLTERISKIKLYWPQGLKESKLKVQPLEFFDWGIAYDPVTNEINMGIHSLKYPNEETILAVFSHEIGHSFDSCRWGAFFQGPWPFEKVGVCLRSPESANAKKRDDRNLDDLIKTKQLNQTLAQGLKLNSTCNKAEYPPIGLQADQLPESFADWFSAELIANISPFNRVNLRSDLCENIKLNPGSAYIPNRDRLEKIYFAHPKFREFIQTKSSPTQNNSSSNRILLNNPKYCSMDSN